MAYLSIKNGHTVSKSHKGLQLTGKMLSFIDAYFGEGEFVPYKALKLSAYKTDKMTERSIAMMAAELMNHPLVLDEIKTRQEKRAAVSEVKAEYLIQKLMTIIEETQADNPNACLRAIELAGKSIALWKERQEISGVDGAAIKHEQHVKESVADFSSRISSLAERNRTNNVVELPVGRREGGT